MDSPEPDNFSYWQAQPAGMAISVFSSSHFQGSAWPVAVAVGTLLAAAYVVYCCVFHPLAHVPGPFIAKFSPLWTMRALWREKFNTELQDLHRNYGPAVRIAPSEVSFASLEAMTAIYARQEDGRFSKHGTFLTLFSDLVLNSPTLITIPDPALHKRLHRVIEQAFTPQALARQEPIQKQHIGRAKALLDEAAAGASRCDLADVLETMFWEIIGDLAFGEPLMAGKRPTFESLKRMGKRSMPGVEMLGALLSTPGVAPAIEAARGLFSMLPVPSQLSKIVPSRKLRDCIVRQDGRDDFLTAILRSEEQGLKLDSDALFSNAMGLTLAGYQTTATTLAATLYHVLRSPAAYRALCAEVRSGFAAEADITGEAVKARLPFLQACVQETLRLLPPANGKTAQRTAMADSCVVAGVAVPAGTVVSADLYSIQRSPEHFARAGEFCPERWLARRGRVTRKQGLYDADNWGAYRPFLIGTRACIGRHMAQQSIRLILATLLWNYDFELLDRDGFVWERDAVSSLIYTDYKVEVLVKKVFR
ncbi:hypothetical protein INS49_002458 [Diaporthe citri]|uniref:uncharacterized protein n=1 Tax=Diaporthe citri TaxID=83186 RepID=UPI001C7FCA15|nr:uncharacterized protein INS49_002458 [Diaporthe citri]KAG6368256.1 hypothetical protein INS49_002458 [Diaporthe citri]